jgi:hypothetical protein
MLAARFQIFPAKKTPKVKTNKYISKFFFEFLKEFRGLT